MDEEYKSKQGSELPTASGALEKEDARAPCPPAKPAGRAWDDLSNEVFWCLMIGGLVLGAAIKIVGACIK